MSISNFKIALNNPQEIIYSGQEVSGTLSFQTTKEKRMKGVEIKVHGEAHVRWRERRGKRRHTYSNRETYFIKSVFVEGGPNEDMTLPPGDYSYPFNFLLPHNIPSSFESCHGHIRYVIKGKIIRDWRFDYSCKRAFTVLSPLDLNNEIDIQEPYQRSTEEVVCGGCCGSEAITLVVNFPSRGFVPGQKATAVIEVDNPTEEQIALKCELIQKIIFLSKGGHIRTWKHVLANEGLGFHKGPGSMIEQSNLQIPAVPASLHTLSKCIFIEYKIRVQCCVVSAIMTYPTIDVPIIVGTIPLRTQFPFITAAEPSAPALPSQPSATPDVHPVSTTSNVLYPEMPPPSYEECMSGKANIRSEEDDEYVQGDMEFAPRYPMYHFK